jgi:hypothetical protein
MMYYGGDVIGMPAMPGMPVIAPMPAMPPMPPSAEWKLRGAPIQLEIAPELQEQLEGVRMNLDQMRPALERIKGEPPRMMEKIRIPDVRVKLDWGTATTI